MTASEQNFIATAQTGEDGGYSECLLAVNDWTKSLALHVNDYEIHVLDDDLDPWEYLVDQRYIDAGDVEYLAQEGRVDDYDIPDSLLAEAGVSTAPQEADD